MDLSAAHLSGLPFHCTESDMVETLGRLGFTVTTKDIRLSHDVSHRKTFAYIRVQDYSFATRLSDALSAQSVIAMTATPVPVPSFAKTGHHRVDSSTVIFSWHKAVRTVWLNFGTQQVANRVREKLFGGRYKICGSTFEPPPPRSASPVGRRMFNLRGTSHNSQAWTVVVNNVPAEVTKSTVEAAILDFYDRPRHIELGPPSYTQSEAEVIEAVKSLAADVGPVQNASASSDSSSKRLKLKVTFQDENEASRAVKDLHDRKLPFSGGKLTAHVVHTARFKVASHIVNAIRGKIEGMGKGFATSNVRLIVFENDGKLSYNTIKLTGADAQDVALAKNELRDLLEGRVAKHQGNVIWTPSLTGNGDCFRALKQIQASTGALIVREKRRTQLRLFGTDAQCTAAEHALMLLMEAEKATSNIIELSPAEVHWACNGGFKAISAALEDSVARFDIVSKPKRITVTGSEKDVETARAMVKDRLLQLGKEHESTGGDCSVCWTEADHPVTTDCGHLYCLECFENMCTTGTGHDELIIKCHGDMGNCQKIFPLKELKSHLSSGAFEDVLKISFETYVRRRPSEFRYCASADCDQIYRATVDARSYTCPECLTIICTTCHISHSGITCAEAKYLKSGEREAFERFKREHDIKDCPKCSAPIEKTDGCNHMTCRVCETHICWVCLAFFGNSRSCYEHMTKIHGGIFPGEYLT
jgi:hypothetical protein